MDDDRCLAYRGFAVGGVAQVASENVLFEDSVQILKFYTSALAALFLLTKSLYCRVVQAAYLSQGGCI